MLHHPSSTFAMCHGVLRQQRCGRMLMTPGNAAVQAVLHVAGDKPRRRRWRAGCSSCRCGLRPASCPVDRHPASSPDRSGDAFGDALLYLETQVAVRRFGDTWVRWTGDTAANMTEAALRVLGAPATAEAILATVNSAGSSSLERVNAMLSKHYQFMRASRTTWWPAHLGNH